MNTVEIGYALSASAYRFIEYERTQTMVRDRARTCAAGELSALLAKHGLPVSAAVLDFEANLGGWCSSNPHAYSGYGVYLCLQEGERCSLVASALRRRSYIFEGTRDEMDEDGETAVLWGTGYPRAFFMDRPLVVAGMNSLDAVFFLGGTGEMYLWLTDVYELRLLAGCARTMLESDGLAYLKGQGWFEAHVCADVGALVTAELGLERFEPGSDHLFEWWINDAAQVRLVPDYAPCITGTHMACKREVDFLKVMRRIKGQLNVDRIRIWKRANGITDQRGIDSLQRAGIECEILTGPGPGHGGSAYDVSLCDPKNWT